MAQTDKYQNDMETVQIEDPKEKEKSIFEVSRRMLPQMIEGSSAHGWSNAYTAPNAGARVFWILLVIGGTCGLITNLVFVFQHFMKEPTFTYTSESNSFKWPDITLCNPGSPIPFSRDPELIQKWRGFQKQVETVKNSSALFSQRKDSLDSVLFLSTINREEFQMNNSKNFIDYVHVKDIVKQRNYFIRAKQLQSRWMYGRFQYACQTISYENLKGMFPPEFNPPEIQASIQLHLNDYLAFNSTWREHVLYMFITPPNGSFLGAKHSTFNTGRKVNVEISYSHISRIAKGSKCRDFYFKTDVYDSSLVRSFPFDGGYYECVAIAKQNIILKECKCYNPVYPIHVTEQVPPRLCYNMTLFNASQLENNYRCIRNTRLYRRKFKECNVYLKIECDEVLFGVKQHENQYVEEVTDRKKVAMEKFLKRSRRYKTEENWYPFFKNNVIYMSFLKESDSVTHLHEEFAYPFSQLLSDIGGLLGLWIGLSVIGLFELLEILGLSLILLGEKCYRINRRKWSA